MSDMDTLLAEQTARLLEHHWDRGMSTTQGDGQWPAALWQALADASLPDILVPEEHGGPGSDLADAIAVLKVAGAYAMPVPLAETIVARAALASAGLAELPAGPLGIAFADCLRTPGRAPNREPHVHWPDQLAGMVTLTANTVELHARTGLQVDRIGANLAGEPRARVKTGSAAVAMPLGRMPLSPMSALALLTAAQMVGAMHRVLEIVVGYAQERIQFGRPIGNFQAVQQLIAALAAQAACASAAVDAACSRPVEVLAWVAKARASEAAGRVSAAAHQVLGAIGYTREYHLHPLTRRLWVWRDAAGDESFWNARIAEHALARGAAIDLWAYITAMTQEQACPS